MLSFERQQAILDYIRQHHSAKVTELSEHFYISETSIRRDLHKLERSGLIHKTYGGAVLVQGENEMPSLEARLQVDQAAKVSIARKAASMVSNGSIIFLDSSTTALSMVPYLSHLSNLSVVTNGLKIATALADYPQFKIYVLGGLLNSRAFSVRGTLTQQMLQSMYINLCFCSPRAIDEEGNVLYADEEEATVRRLVIQHSDETVLLCSTRKLGQRAAFRMCGLSDISAVACEEAPHVPWLDEFVEQGLQII